MTLHGKSIIAGTATDSSSGSFTARGDLARFEEANVEQVHSAFGAAESAFPELRNTSAERRAEFLERIGAQIESLGDELLTTDPSSPV